MKKPAVWIGLAFLAGFLVWMFASTFRAARYRCEVCMVFEGRRDCRTAAADTQQHALRTAISNACAQISAGVTDTSRCESTPPASVRWIESPR